MKTYTWKKIQGYDVAVSDDTGKVHHAVSKDGQRTLYPYKPNRKENELDNCCDEYSPEQWSRKLHNGTGYFK